MCLKKAELSVQKVHFQRQNPTAHIGVVFSVRSNFVPSIFEWYMFGETRAGSQTCVCDMYWPVRIFAGASNMSLHPCDMRYVARLCVVVVAIPVEGMVTLVFDAGAVDYVATPQERSETVLNHGNTVTTRK